MTWRYSIGFVLRIVIEISPSGLNTRILPSAVRSSVKQRSAPLRIRYHCVQ